MPNESIRAVSGFLAAGLIPIPLIAPPPPPYSSKACSDSCLVQPPWTPIPIPYASPPPPIPYASPPPPPTLQNPFIAPSPAESEPPPASLSEEVLRELNRVRENPRAYGEKLRRFMTYFDNERYEAPGSETVVITQEGALAVEDAIASLQCAGAAAPFSLSKGMANAALDHVRDIGPLGNDHQDDHRGTDGSSPFDRMNRYGKWKITAMENLVFGEETAEGIVAQMMIDDGVPSRGHRKAVLNPAFKVVGISSGPHRDYKVMCVVTFAGGYIEAGAKARPKKQPSPIPLPSPLPPPDHQCFTNLSISPAPDAEADLMSENIPITSSPTLAPPAETFMGALSSPRGHSPSPSALGDNAINAQVQCAGCQQPLSGQFLAALGRKWHPNCFKCTRCCRSLESKFKEKEGVAYCSGCHADLFAPKCYMCCNAISGTIVKALGKTFHQECFVCTACRKAFPDGTFIVKDDHQYCETCAA